MPDEPVLEVADLHSAFRVRDRTVVAVDGVSFKIGRGECLGLVGESGSGKTTTGLSLLRLLPPSARVEAGAIRLLGRDLAALAPAALRAIRGDQVGMIFQDPTSALNPTKTIGRQITEPLYLHRKVSRRAARARAVEVLELVGVPHPTERLGAYPHQLSGGLRQRVMIAIALACEPQLLIADEPTTALDVSIQAQILDLIDELRRRLEMAVILITHDLGVIATRTDRVAVMYAGRIVEAAPTRSLFGAVRHPYTAALLAAIPRLDADRRGPLYNIPGMPPDLSRPPGGCRFHPRCERATRRCAEEEVPLAASEEEGPSGWRAAAGAVAIATPRTSPRSDSHVFACFHPLTDPAPDAHEARASTTAGDPGLRSVPSAPATGDATTALIELEAVSKAFSVSADRGLPFARASLHAVDDVSLAIRCGETFGLVGESGSGKTTLGRLIVALERPSSGRVLFDGADLRTLKRAALRERRRDLQLMYQDPYASLDPRMRVGATIREPLAIQRVGSRDEQRRRVLELLDEVGLARSVADVYPHELSGGQRQRVGLARALALSPQVVVADEPVSALDVSIQAQVLNLMRAVQERHRLTYVLISHDLSVVRYLADAIGVMYLGKLVELGPVEALFAHPAHPYTRGLIDAIPLPDPSSAKGSGGRLLGELPSALSPPSGCRFRTRCPHAQPVCAEVEAPLRPFGVGHTAACHFPLEPPMDR